MIQMGTIKENEKVQYVDNKGKCVLYGEVTYDGILCGSCNKDMSISEFEAHSRINASDPLRNIYVEKGNSLLQCMIETWNKQDESAREDFHIFAPREGDHWDDVCAVCGTDDGNLFICCESCTLTFHKSCLDMEPVSGTVLTAVANSVARMLQIKWTALKDFSCLSFLNVVCVAKDVYHKSCGEASGGDDFNSEQAFCDKKCKEIFERLQLLLGVQHKLDDNYTWRFIRRAAIGSNALQIEPHVIECNSKLAVAMSIMNDCFKPFADSRSGINMMNSVVYNRGSNFARLNCSRFFTAILESGDEVISVANLRIHEKKVAEMPYVATGPLYMNQGMWRRLMKGIVWALGYLEVETLVIPAVPHLENFWCASFGFERVDENDEKVMKKMNMLVFPHSVVLKKTIPKYTGFYDPDAAVPQHQKSKSRSKSKRVRRAN
ncbi:hypothetical protein RJT34_20096 [Clitoria ternatea]|uniref:Zinc finger PHD-type domain-containing protein n=1 Tax=Clitoria ternatea TaxID=43366 RepID=A0AAN9ISP9_CLITE